MYIIHCQCQKFYEHKDHLGNVRMTFSDMKQRDSQGAGITNYELRINN
jgi:hypothetical protein